MEEKTRNRAPSGGLECPSREKVCTFSRKVAPKLGSRHSQRTDGGEQLRCSCRKFSARGALAAPLQQMNDEAQPTSAELGRVILKLSRARPSHFEAQRSSAESFWSSAELGRVILKLSRARPSHFRAQPSSAESFSAFCSVRACPEGAPFFWHFLAIVI